MSNFSPSVICCDHEVGEDPGVGLAALPGRHSSTQELITSGEVEVVAEQLNARARHWAFIVRRVVPIAVIIAGLAAGRGLYEIISHYKQGKLSEVTKPALSNPTH